MSTEQLVTEGNLMNAELQCSSELTTIAQDIITKLRCLLENEYWNQAQYLTLINLFNRLSTHLLQCRQFTLEFLRLSGHTFLFQYVEILSDQRRFYNIQSINRSNSEFTYWNSLLRCLIHLSEYAIDNSTPSTIDLNQTIIRNSESVNDERINQLDHIFDHYDEPYISSTKSDQLFSWCTATDKFLDVLIEQVFKETNLDCASDGLKLIAKIITDFPARIKFFIRKNLPKYIFDQLERLHHLNLISNVLPKKCSSFNYSLNRIVEFHKPSLSSAAALANLSLNTSSTLNTPVLPLMNNLEPQLTDLATMEMQFLLLLILYAQVYQSRFDGDLQEFIERNLQFSQLKQLVTCVPQLCSRSTWLNFITQSNSSLCNFKKSLELRELVQLKENVLEKSVQFKFDAPVPGTQREQQQVEKVEINDSVCSESKPNSIGSSSSHLSSVSLHQCKIFNVYCKLQQTLCSQLLDDLHTPLDRESIDASNKIRELCSWVRSCGFSHLASDQSEFVFRLLGAQFPKDPFSDFQSRPGLLGFDCIYTFFKNNQTILSEMLNYGVEKSYLRRVDPAIPHNHKYSNDCCNYLLNDRSIANAYRFDEPCIDHPVLNYRITLYPLEYLCGNELDPRPNRDYIQTDLDSWQDLCSYHTNRYFFPIIQVSKNLVELLCDLLRIESKPTPPRPVLMQEQHFDVVSLLYPVLIISSDQCSKQAFENLFGCVFPYLFDSWTRMNAVPNDMNQVFYIFREQLIQALLTVPTTLDEFRNALSSFSSTKIRGMLAEHGDNERFYARQNHPAIVQLRKDLTTIHKENVKANRLNFMCNTGLDYLPSKTTKVASKVLLSADHKTLIVCDKPNSVKETWPLTCVTQVNVGFEEKVKKNPKPTIKLQIEVRDTSFNQEESLDFQPVLVNTNTSTLAKSKPIQVTLLAQSLSEHKFWLDGLHLLCKLNDPSELYERDVQRLVDLDIKIRLIGLDLTNLPESPLPLPPEPPELNLE